MMRRQSLELAIAALLFAGLWPSNTAPQVQPDPQPIVEPDQCEPVEPEPLPAPRKHAVVELYVAPFDCPPCDRAKAKLPELTAKGWTCTAETGSAEFYPYWYIWLDGQQSDKQVGELTYSRLRRLIGKMKGESISGAEVSGQGATGSGDALRTSTGSGLVRIQPSRPYTPRWTWPGNLRTHLQGYPHYIDTTGMTQDDLERTHDALHDAGRMTTRRTTRTVRRG